MNEEALKKMMLPTELNKVIKNVKKIIIPETRAEILDLALGGNGADTFDVEFDVDGKPFKEAWVIKCKNGIVANYPESYMRRRDPESMLIADEYPTDKTRHDDIIKTPFDQIRKETFDWLAEREELILMPFFSGNSALDIGYQSLLVVPANAAFFAASLADLQGFIPCSKIPALFKPKAIIYVAPPFRHKYYNGKQYVVHNRQFEHHEVFSYNLYPGPSAKKGVYAVLLNIGEQEHWITAHAATVKVITPYERQFVVMHEGASGGGKSEMLEQFKRERDGKVLLGVNIVNQERVKLTISDMCDLMPITDDMALCHPSIQTDSNKLVVADAEDGWFLRVNHIDHYGTDYSIESSTIHPKEPLVFINMEAVPNSTCLIWEHIHDTPDKLCPNPRIIMPRSFVKDSIEGAVEVDIRSFGLRQPPSTKENPNYGIAGIFHVLPPALAWLWRIVAPRGYANPSISDSEGMKSEGVGSFWPFATGKRVNYANLLLEQILKTTSTRYILVPNQYIGAYKVGFTGQWVAREFLSRRGEVKFRPDQLEQARCPILGYCPAGIKMDGNYLPKIFLKTELQPELGVEAYDIGAKMLTDFFKSEITQYLTADIHPMGRKIIESCLGDASVEDYYNFIPKL
ncbi:MAG: DUF4914 family protein [Clostridiales bacterium]|jgi:hypothetical protein|nr:DUF4914 family protein [Clostridiales bacterium]